MTKKLTIKLDEHTVEWLRQQSVREHRSVSGQARFFLEQVRQANPDGPVIPPEALAGAADKFEAALVSFIEERKRLMGNGLEASPETTETTETEETEND